MFKETVFGEADNVTYTRLRHDILSELAKFSDIKDNFIDNFKIKVKKDLVFVLFNDFYPIENKQRKQKLGVLKKVGNKLVAQSVEVIVQDDRAESDYVYNFYPVVFNKHNTTRVEVYAFCAVKQQSPQEENPEVGFDESLYCTVMKRLVFNNQYRIESQSICNKWIDSYFCEGSLAFSEDGQAFVGMTRKNGENQFQVYRRKLNVNTLDVYWETRPEDTFTYPEILAKGADIKSLSISEQGDIVAVGLTKISPTDSGVYNSFFGIFECHETWKCVKRLTDYTRANKTGVGHSVAVSSQFGGLVLCGEPFGNDKLTGIKKAGHVRAFLRSTNNSKPSWKEFEVPNHWPHHGDGFGSNVFIHKDGLISVVTNPLYDGIFKLTTFEVKVNTTPTRARVLSIKPSRQLKMDKHLQDDYFEFNEAGLKLQYSKYSREIQIVSLEWKEK